MGDIYGNEATSVDLKIIDSLKAVGWVVGDSLLYRPRYTLTEEQKNEFGKSFIEPDIVLQDPYSKEILAVIENKLENEKKAFAQLRIDNMILKPRFLYACSKERVLFYDTSWKGLEAGEYKRTNSFLSYEEIKIKNKQLRKRNAHTEVTIDTSIAGGYDSNVGKDRYYQLDCINTIIDRFKTGKEKMLVHMATGLGKTRTTVALTKALLQHELAKKILFVVDRRMLAKQALDDGFSLISRDYSAARIKTTNFRQQKHASIHVIVIDSLEMIFSSIPSNFYDLIIVDECHRSISVNRKVVLDHFICPKLGLTATPRTAVAKEGANVSEEDLAILDTYKLFGCEDGEPDYKFDLERGIEEGFLAPYDVLEIKTYLTKEAEDEGIPIEYVLNPETRERIDLPKEKRLKLKQLERKYLSEERCMRIAEEIKANTQYGEKVILFGVSQPHCLYLTEALNKVFNDNGSDNVNYAEAVISDNEAMNEFIKNKFKKPNQKPYIVVSVDIMSTGVDVPCVRYISFASLTDSVGKYIQMVGRGSRLDPEKSGKFSFRILDFVGLCSKLGDNGKGSTLPNIKTVKNLDMVGGGSIKGDYFIIDNPDPVEMIQRVFIFGDEFEIIDNIPIKKAKEIFEEEVMNPNDENIRRIKDKVVANLNYDPTQEELDAVTDWINKPNIYLDEGQLQKIYDYPQGSVWDFYLHALGVKSIPTSEERIRNGYESYIQTYNFTDEQLRALGKLKEIFISNISNHKDISIDIIFGNPIYERLIGTKSEIETIFEGKFEMVLVDLKENLNLKK
ncbi:DEAD/DEAH box helicase family protein [Bacillus cereus]|uniref:DEAD/DEAH box helicase family protein n=1 Tax=Bacillus cereus TaxID=1396 RepID=UPI0001A061A1|nr:DEAD/DEAH box helicase family protein [Bacillus cereus]EEK91921.1 Type III restriction protein res subunit [Bacillus cereus BDRD-ST24]MCD1205830.1 DEAD/DEAH box helicase family protein [Bacillus cereus]HDR4548699.1 DEAD/DEAH box helicase family protein [Bacillus cereus]